GIRHQTSVARTPEQNGVVERRNRTLVEAVRTMLSAAKVPLFFWAEAIATRMALEHDNLSLATQCQENVTQADRTVTTSNKLDLLFSPMFNELLNGSSQVLSKSSAVTTVDALNQRQQQQTTPLNNHITHESTCHDPTQAPTVTSTENMNQAEMVVSKSSVVLTADESIQRQ
nr:putative ribonuclease H-like domain-containing protein [Tanacetum cinerariifolium]